MRLAKIEESYSGRISTKWFRELVAECAKDGTDFEIKSLEAGIQPRASEISLKQALWSEINRSVAEGVKSFCIEDHMTKVDVMNLKLFLSSDLKRRMTWLLLKPEGMFSKIDVGLEKSIDKMISFLNTYEPSKSKEGIKPVINIFQILSDRKYGKPVGKSLNFNKYDNVGSYPDETHRKKSISEHEYDLKAAGIKVVSDKEPTKV